MLESKVSAAFLASRQDYDMVNPHLDRELFSPFGTALLESIDAYYKNDPAADQVDLEVLKLSLDRRFKDVPRHAEKMRDKLEEVLSVKTSSINVVAEVIEAKRAVVGTNLADALLAQDNERIEMYLQEYEAVTDLTVLDGADEEEFQGVTLEALEEHFKDAGGWYLSPKALGEKTKSLRQGHAVIIAARPERGKTLVGITQTAGFLEQGAKVLYIGNEDPIPDLVLRLLSNLTGMEEEQLFSEKEKAITLARRRGYDNCVFAGLSPGTLYEVEALIRRHQPDITVVDQMRNIRAKTENNTQRLEVVAQELRNMGRRHNCLMVELTQVGDSGRDKLVLNDGDIDGSNTGIPGACDVIMMVGSNDDFERRDLRVVTFAKNKRGGDHGSVTVSVDRKLSRVMSYGRD